jgi:hypothetical protein
MHAAVDEVFDARARRCEPPPAVDEVLPPFPLRVEALAKRSVATMDAAGMLTLANYRDLVEFHAAGETDASCDIRALDEGSDALREELDALRSHQGPHVTPEEQVTEAAVAMEIRLFWRGAAPAMRRLGAVYLREFLDVPGAGIVLRRGPNGERVIEPYYGGAGLLSRSA